jgi:methyl-accepting chemotaxis protein
MMFKNMTVAVRLFAGFLLVSMIGAIVASIGIVNMGRLSDKADELYENELMGLSYIKEANVNLIYIGRVRGDFLLATTEDERKYNSENIKKYFASVENNLDKARTLFVTDEAKALFTQYAKVAAEYKKELEQALSMAAAEALQTRSKELSVQLVTARKHADSLDQVLTDLARLKEKRAKQASVETTDLYESSRAFMLLLVLISVLSGLALGVLITRSLTRQLGGEPAYAVTVAGRIASGDLATEIDTRPGDHASLLFAMKAMRDSLVNIVTQVRSGTETIATASGQIAAGSQDLSARTEEQAGSLEETASSMEELTSTVKQNAENARQANGLAFSASEVALKGGAAVSEVVNTMGAINDSSKKIVDIIGVIDGIAFQTNILALNAAVEAARAGEQGRGFAVVASEVRNLAQRSAAAAKEIKVLIGDSVEKVELGTKLVDQAGATMEEIVGSIRRVTDIMGEIRAASDEQSAGIEQINQAVAQMDEVTQQNAALVEESASASESMQQQAANLAQVVSVFKLNSLQVSKQVEADTVSPRPVHRRHGGTATAAALRQALPGRRKVTHAAAADSDDWEQF